MLFDVALQVTDPVWQHHVPLCGRLLKEVGRRGNHTIQNLGISEELVRYALVEELPDARLAEHELTELRRYLALRVLEDGLDELVLGDRSHQVVIEGLAHPLGMRDTVEREFGH